MRRLHACRASAVVHNTLSADPVAVTLGPYMPLPDAPAAAFVGCMSSGAAALAAAAATSRMAAPAAGQPPLPPAPRANSSPAFPTSQDTYRLAWCRPPTPLQAAILWKRKRAVDALLAFLEEDAGGSAGGAPVAASAPPATAPGTIAPSAASKYLNNSHSRSFLPLSLAARLDLRDVAEALVALGARPSQRDEAARVTDLLSHNACGGMPFSPLLDADGLPAVLPRDAEAALELKARFSGKASPAFSPLHFAAIAGNAGIVYDFLLWSEQLEDAEATAVAAEAAAAVASSSSSGGDDGAQSRYFYAALGISERKSVRLQGSLGTRASASVPLAHAGARPFSEGAKVLALSVAVHSGRAAVCSLLLGAGVRVSALDLDSFGARPLYRALLLCSPEAGRSLLQDDQVGDGGSGIAGGAQHLLFAGSASDVTQYGTAQRALEHPSPLGVPLPDALRRALVTTIVRKGRAVPRQTTFFALGIATALFATQLVFIVLFTYASPVSPGSQGPATLLYKQHLSAAFQNSLAAAGSSASGGDVTQPANACAFLGWIVANICMQGAAAKLASGAAVPADFGGASGAAACLSQLPPSMLSITGCNVSAAAAALGSSAGAVASRTGGPASSSPLLLGSATAPSAPYASRLTQGTSLVIGALRVTLMRNSAVTNGGGCVPWWAGAGDASLGSTVPAALLDGAPPVSGTGGMGGAARGGGGVDTLCSVFAPTVSADLVTLDQNVPWFTPVDPLPEEALFPYASITGGAAPADHSLVAIRASTLTLPSEASAAVAALPQLLAAVEAVGLPFLSAMRLDVALYQPALDALAAVRLDTSFPPFAPSSTNVAVAVAPVSGFPASLKGLASQLALLCIFLLGNVRSYGTSRRFRWLIVDTLIPCLTLAVIGVRAAAWRAHPWLSASWQARDTRPDEYVNAWSLLAAATADADLSAIVLLLAIFRCVEYLEKSPLGIGITLQSIL